MPRRFAHTSELTPRELEVLRVLVRGGKNRAIAGELGISEYTVGQHLESIYVKLAVQGRGSAIAWAVQRGILP